VLGALAFSFLEAVEFDAATRTFLATLGEQCGLALERARAFSAERAARELSASTLASIHDGFVAFDRAFCYLYVNPAAEALLRRPAELLLGRSMRESFPEAWDAPLGLALRRVMETRQAETFEGASAVRGGWLEARVYPSPDGATVFFQDATARRRAQEASAFLAEASGLLNESLDYTSTLKALARAAVPRLGDWCVVDVVRDPESGIWPPVVDRLAVVHEDPAKIALAHTFEARYPTDWCARRRASRATARATVSRGHRRAGTSVDNARLYSAAEHARQAAGAATGRSPSFRRTPGFQGP
jgi:hypothetical protein